MKGASGLGGGVRWVFGLFKLLFTLRGAISITLLIVIIGGIGAIQESREQNSPEPFIAHVGGELLHYDVELYKEAKLIEERGGAVLDDEKNVLGRWLGFFKMLGNAVTNIWYMFTFGRIFYWFSALIVTNNDSQKFGNIVVACILLFLFPIATTLINTAETPDGYNPLLYGGLRAWVGVLPDILHPFSTAELGTNETVVVNETITPVLTQNDTLTYIVDMVNG